MFVHPSTVSVEQLIPACSCSRPCIDLPVDGGKRKQIFSMGITHLSISVSTLCLSACLCVSAEWLKTHLIHLLLSFFRRKLMPTAHFFLLCKVVSLAYVTSQCNHIYSPLLCLWAEQKELLTSQVSQRPQQASVVMCRPPQPGFLARKVNSLTAQPMKRRRLTADTWWREMQSRSTSSSPDLLTERRKYVNKLEEKGGF